MAQTNGDTNGVIGDHSKKPDFDAVVVGAGFAGLRMIHELRTLGLTCKVLEAGTGVGGTWCVLLCSHDVYATDEWAGIGIDSKSRSHNAS